MGDKWLDEEVLEDALGFANLKIIKMTTVFLEHTNRFLKIHHISMNIKICVYWYWFSMKKLEY